MDLMKKQDQSFRREKRDHIPAVYFTPDDPFPFKENYGDYIDLTKSGYCEINTSVLNIKNWKYHLDSIINIMKDGIESDMLQKAKIHVIFADNVVLNLSIFDYYFNMIMWNLPLSMNEPITSEYLFFPKDITKKTIKKYIDEKFIKKFKDKYIGHMDSHVINNLMNIIVDRSLHQFSTIDDFSLYLANTINIEDNIPLMKQYPEYNSLMHADLSKVPIESVKDVGMELTFKAIDYIKNSDHCLADSFRAGEGINPRQYKEFSINIGSKPDGQGGIFPTIINKSFINGGVDDMTSFFIESHGGRTAQIIAKCNVGTSGHFARLLGLNNRDTIIHNDPNYTCNTKHFEKITIKNEKFLERFENRYYRFNPNGVEYRLNAEDTHLIGQTLYFRSPMTCASYARGEGICYKCYGDLVYTNSDINIGQLASELLSSALTQRLLSAKHLLEAAVRALEWPDLFSDLFQLECNVVTLHDDFNYTGYTLIIDPENITLESEDDNYEYNEYLKIIEIRDPLGDVHQIHSKGYDNLYLSNGLNEVIKKYYDEDDGKIEIEMTRLQDKDLFLIYIMNNELSKTLEMIKSIINKREITQSFDKDSILQEFVETVMNGGLDTTAVHLEVILANQLRSMDDILLKPEWEYPNANYSILTLNEALNNNPSITTTMSYQKLSKVFYSPLSYKKHGTSFLDLLFMERPQEFIQNKELVSNDFSPKSDKDEVKPLVTFDDNVDYNDL